MAMDDLLAARVDLSIRGIMTQLLQQGWHLDDPATGRRAAAEYLQRHPGRRGNRVRDVHEIAQDVRRSLRAGQRMNQGEELRDGRSIPRTSSAERSSGERYRYFVVVVIDDPSSGGLARIPVTISSGTPLSRDEVRARAAGAVAAGHVDREYRGKVGVHRAPVVNSIIIVSVDRSH